MKYAATLARWMASRRTFYVVIALLVLGAGWIACTASYPMAFDESFHFGIIQIYAQQWSPILTSTPVAGYGSLTHDPSYLYHYLMSFPYRIVRMMTSEFAYQVVILRWINIGIFVAGLAMYRKLFLRFGVSAALTHVVLLMLVLIPVTPFLAAHINYDNLLFLMTPVHLWFVYSCASAMRTGKRVDARALLLVVSSGMATSLVKYAFLPIFVASTMYLVGTWIGYGRKTTTPRAVWQSYLREGRRAKLVLAVSLIISTGLFLQRYAVNIVQYGSVQPDCAKVEPLESCLRYGPWARNYNLELTAQTTSARPESQTLVEFLPEWIAALMHKLYFAINYDFKEYAPLPIPITMAYIVGSVGVCLALVFARSLWRYNAHIVLLVLVIVVYALTLLNHNYSEYLRFDKMVAVNGRYFMPLLPLIFVIIGLGYRQLIVRYAKKYAVAIKTSLVVVVTLLALQGGGAMTYLIHSEPVWYWQGGPLTSFNTELKKIVTMVVVGAKQ